MCRLHQEPFPGRLGQGERGVLARACAERPPARQAAQSHPYLRTLACCSSLQPCVPARRRRVATRQGSSWTGPEIWGLDARRLQTKALDRLRRLSCVCGHRLRYALRPTAPVHVLRPLNKRIRSESLMTTPATHLRGSRARPADDARGCRAQASASTAWISPNSADKESGSSHASTGAAYA